MSTKKAGGETKPHPSQALPRNCPERILVQLYMYTEKPTTRIGGGNCRPADPSALCGFPNRGIDNKWLRRRCFGEKRGDTRLSSSPFRSIFLKNSAERENNVVIYPRRTKERAKGDIWRREKGTRIFLSLSRGRGMCCCHVDIAGLVLVLCGGGGGGGVVNIRLFFARRKNTDGGELSPKHFYALACACAARALRNRYGIPKDN